MPTPTQESTHDHTDHLAELRKKNLFQRHWWFSAILLTVGLAIILGVITTVIQMTLGAQGEGRQASVESDSVYGLGSAPALSALPNEAKMVGDSGSGGGQGITDTENVIRTVSLDAFVQNLDTAIARTKELVGQNGGRVDSLNRSTNGSTPCYGSYCPIPYYGGEIMMDSATGSSPKSLQASSQETAYLTLRVPANKVDAVKDELKKLTATGRFESESDNLSDVGKQKADTNARLNQWKNERDVLNGLLARAQSVDEVLRVRSELTSVQANIDSYQAQLDYLNDQTSLATISLSLRTIPTATSPIEPTATYNAIERLKQAWQSLIYLGQRVLDIAIYAVVYLVIIVPIALIVWLIRRARRKTKQNS